MATGDAVLTLVDSDSPPLRLFLRESPLRIVVEDYGSRLATRAQWQQVAAAAQAPKARRNLRCPCPTPRLPANALAASTNGTAGPGRRLRGSIPGARRPREQPHSGLVAGVLCLLFFAAGAPSPLYGIYRAQLRFSATTLTAVFAIYALVLLITAARR